MKNGLVSLSALTCVLSPGRGFRLGTISCYPTGNVNDSGAGFSQESGSVSPSPWGEGRDEISPNNSRIDPINPNLAIANTRKQCLPLPGGEGRGEGELYSNFRVHGAGGRHTISPFVIRHSSFSHA